MTRDWLAENAERLDVATALSDFESALGEDSTRVAALSGAAVTVDFAGFDSSAFFAESVPPRPATRS